MRNEFRSPPHQPICVLNNRVYIRRFSSTLCHQVTSYQRSCSGSSPNSPDTFQSQLEIQPIQSMPRLAPLPAPILMCPTPLPMKWHQAPSFGVRISSQESSSGYNSGSSSSSLFHALRKAPSEQSVLFPGEQLTAAPRKPVVASQSLSSQATSSSSSNHSRPSRATFLKESLVRVLDQVDARVAFFRETANELEEEKRKLLEALANVENTNELALIEEGKHLQHTSLRQGRIKVKLAGHE